MADTPNVDAKADPKADPALKAQADARAADAKAQEAQAKAVDAGKSKEQLAADKARAEADDAKAKAAEHQAQMEAEASDAMTTVDAAKVMAPVPGDMSVGDHFAQKFGNDPRNPKLAPGLDGSDDAKTVKITRVTPDAPVPVTTYCHPEMVGDYLRAGWNVA